MTGKKWSYTLESRELESISSFNLSTYLLYCRGVLTIVLRTTTPNK